MRFVTYTVAEGLSNRLRIHLTAHAYAIHCDAKLLVDWPVVQACGARYGDLFEYSDGVTDGRGGLGKITLSLLKPRQIRMNGLQGPQFRDVRDLPIPRAGLVNFGEIFRPYAYEDGGRVLGPFKKRVTDALRPVPAVREVVEALSRQLKSPYVGVHIRRGDFHVSFPEKLLPLDFYRKCMSSIASWRPGVTFYLSCDDDEFARPLIDEFSPCTNIRQARQAARSARDVFGYDNRCNRDTVTGVREALIDLLMLARSQVLLGAPGSSFSAIAPLLGCTSLVLPKAATDAEAERCSEALGHLVVHSLP